MWSPFFFNSHDTRFERVLQLCFTEIVRSMPYFWYILTTLPRDNPLIQRQKRKESFCLRRILLFSLHKSNYLIMQFCGGTRGEPHQLMFSIDVFLPYLSGSVNHLQSNCVIPECESDPAFNGLCRVLPLLAARSTVRFLLSRTACYSNCLSSTSWKSYHLDFQQSEIFHLPKPHRFLQSTYVHTALPVVSWPFHSILKHLGCLHKIMLEYVMSFLAKR